MNKNKTKGRHIPYLSIKTLPLHHHEPSFFPTWGYFLPPGGFTFLFALTPHRSIHGGNLHEPRLLSGFKTQNRPLMAQNENFPKQRKYKYFTSQKSVITEKQDLFFTEKHFTLQEVFHVKILHFTTTIFTQKQLMSQISFFTR